MDLVKFVSYSKIIMKFRHIHLEIKLNIWNIEIKMNTNLKTFIKWYFQINLWSICYGKYDQALMFVNCKCNTGVYEYIHIMFEFCLVWTETSCKSAVDVDKNSVVLAAAKPFDLNAGKISVCRNAFKVKLRRKLFCLMWNFYLIAIC